MPYVPILGLVLTYRVCLARTLARFTRTPVRQCEHAAAAFDCLWSHGTRAYSPVKQQVGTSILPIANTKNILIANIRNKLVVDPYPGLSWFPIREISIRVQHVQCVMSARRGKAVVVKDAE